MMNRKHDVIVLGSGLAGLRAAIEAARNPEVDVAIISKVQLMRSHSVCAEGGTAAMMQPEEGDSFELQKKGTALNFTPGILPGALISSATRMWSSASSKKCPRKFSFSNTGEFPGHAALMDELPSGHSVAIASVELFSLPIKPASLKCKPFMTRYKNTPM